MKSWEAVLLGVVEGLTEFLPVSSTGHLILVAHILGIQHDNFTKSFQISIQLGAILAILFLYRDRLLRDKETWKRIILAFLPTGVIGFLLYKLIKGYLIGNDSVVVTALFLGGVVLILADRKLHSGRYKDVDEVPLLKAFLIGFFQSIAVIPGVSRSGATIVGGLLLGLDRKTAAEFAFLLAVPTMFAATGYDLLKSGGEFSSAEWKTLGIGFISAFLSALAVVKWFLDFLKKHGLWIFGVYRIILSLLYASLFLL